MANRFTRFFASAALPIALLVLWEVAARQGWVSRFLLPPLSDVAARFAEDVANGDLLRAAGDTLWRLAVSYSIAAVLGVVLGILMAHVALVRWFFDPIVSIAFPAPKISLLPIFILWFGVFDTPKIVMTVFSCIFPIIAATWAATQGVDKYLVWSAENLGTRRGEMLWRIVFPAILPQVFTGLQVALPIAFITVIVTEMLTGGSGLGGAMMEGARLAHPEQALANLFAIGLFGYIAMKGLGLLRRRVLVWHEEVQRQEVLA